MRFAHMADLHVTEGARLADQRSVLGGVVADIEREHVDLVLLAGDFTGRRVPHRSTPAERSVLLPALVRLAKVAPVVCLVGNHDDADDLALVELLDGHWPIRVVRAPGHLVVQTPCGRAHLWCLPYPTRRGLLGERAHPGGVGEQRDAMHARIAALLAGWAAEIRALRVSAPTEPHLLLAHLTVAGSALAGGEVLDPQEVEASREALDALGVDYGALGHLHLRQEPAARCWYPGSIWRGDFGETDPKGWHLVRLNLDVARACVPGAYEGGDGRQACFVEHRPSGCRDFVTLDWSWGATDGPPGWLARPSDEAVGRGRGAEVRCRLTVPEEWSASCPWAAELERVVDAGAVRCQVERRVVPAVRVRAPAVVEARAPADKLRAYWSTLDAPPSSEAQREALAVLADLTSGERA